MDYDINLKHLSYFITTARLGSINRAAQTLYISQPHLGKIIKELERTAGTMLFERTRGGVNPDSGWKRLSGTGRGNSAGGPVPSGLPLCLQSFRSFPDGLP